MKCDAPWSGELCDSTPLNEPSL